jgi:predicted AAA+ superfamily ATPase
LEIDYIKYKDINDLDQYIKNYIKAEKIIWRLYLFVDEIQELSWWEKLINAYRADDSFDVDIFITWSNANLLSSDLSTYLAWRYIDFEIFPFSYVEYLEYHNLENSKSNFLNYLNTSWIPEIYKLEDFESKLNFLKSLKDSVILKDIVKRYNIKDIDLLERLFFYLSWNIWNLFSLNSIVKKLKWLQIHTNTNTIWNYINFLVKTYIIHWVDRYDLKWKKILEWEKKYYLNDLAFNNFFSSSYDIWGWKKLENIVYNYLRQNWFNIYVWNIWDLEIDFVAEKWKDRIYIQVAYLITDEVVMQREFWNLLKIKDNFPKYVISLDEILIQDYKWIIHNNIWDFLSIIK